MSVWYLELDDEITDAVARLRAAKDDRVVFVVPAGSRIGTGRINFRLLAREAASRGLRIALVSGDPQVRALAASAGLPTYASVGESERGAATEGPLRLDTATPDDAASDTTSATATITTAPGPGSGVRAAGSRPVRRPRSRRQKVVLTVGAVGLVALVGGGSLLALYRSVPTASITLALAPRAFGPVPLAITVSASTPTDPETGTVQGQLEPVTVTGEAVVTATERRNVSDRAEGSVTFVNASTSLVPIPDLTPVATADGVRFLTQHAIQGVEPGGTATVEVRAELQGDQGNVPAGAIAVVDPSLAAQLGEGGGVTNPEPTTGGTTAEKPFFSQADYDQAVEQLRADLRSRLATVVPEARPGVIAYPGTAQQANDMVVLQEPGEVVGRVGPETTISGSLQANVLTVSREQLTEVALRMLAAAASPDSLVSGGEHVTLGEPVIESARASYRADADAVVYGLHASIADLREQVRSKTIAEAQRILGVHGTATITLSPDWLPALPDDPSRIEIAPEPPSPGATPVPMISPVPSHSPGAPASPSPVISPLPGASLAPGASDAVPTPLPSGAPTPPPSGTLTPRSSGAPGELASQEPAA